MARTCASKPHFLNSPGMRQVNLGAQFAFVRLWLLADDAGRVEDHARKPHLLPAKLHPGRDEVTTRWWAG